MLQRTVSVDSIKIVSVGISSVLQIGDSNNIQGTSRAIAVQREHEHYFGNEGNFNDYPIFSEPIPLPPIEEDILISTFNLSPFIKVGRIRMIGVSSSSVVHLGNTRQVEMESRVKHIRQLLPND